jgi:multiple sugar transport system ATP-binding protein
VIHGVSVGIADGEFVILVGPSGCGKSTLLRMIAGLDSVSAGAIRIGERVVNDLPPKDRDIAMVFQTYALYPHKTVAQNMGFALRMRKAPPAEIEARVRRAAEILDLVPYLGRYPRQLSGGQRQRVAMGRAIVRDPAVFLFDEPLSNLDAKLRVQMRVELKRLHEQLETTAIYVTHDQVEAMTLGDRVVVMKDGRVQQVGEPLELYGRPANKFVAGFIGSPAMNFVDVTIAAAGGALWAEAAGLRLKVPSHVSGHIGQRVTLGVRPEALRLANGADDHTIATAVDVVEPLGNEILLNFRAGGVPMVARVDPSVRVKAHESIHFALDPQRLHFFDAKTENAL